MHSVHRMRWRADTPSDDLVVDAVAGEFNAVLDQHHIVSLVK